METGSLIVVSICVFAVFTAIMGAGLLFYQDHIVLTSGPEPVKELTAVNQGGAIMVLLFFMMAGIVFFMGAVRWVGKSR
jgi:Zn-dependent protease with chaperone function